MFNLLLQPPRCRQCGLREPAARGGGRGTACCSRGGLREPAARWRRGDGAGGGRVRYSNKNHESC